MAIALKDILGAMLSDALRAQHESNTFLHMMAEQYAANGRLAGLRPPSAMLGELEFKLNYAVAGGIEEKEEESLNGKEIDKTLQYVARETAVLLIKTMVHTIQNSGINYKDRFSFVDTLPDNREFRRHLAKRFTALLTDDHKAVVNPDASLSEAALYRILYTAAEEYLLDHEDIRDLFKGEGRALHDAIKAEFDRVLNKELDDILRESAMPSFRHIQRYNSLKVEVANEALAKLPPEAIQTMTIRIVPSQQEIKIDTASGNNKQ